MVGMVAVVAAAEVADGVGEIADVVPAGVAALAVVAGVVTVAVVAAVLVAAAPALVALGVDLSEPPPQAASSITPTSSIASFFTIVSSNAPNDHIRLRCRGRTPSYDMRDQFAIYDGTDRRCK